MSLKNSPDKSSVIMLASLRSTEDLSMSIKDIKNEIKRLEKRAKMLTVTRGEKYLIKQKIETKNNDIRVIELWADNLKDSWIVPIRTLYDIISFILRKAGVWGGAFAFLSNGQATLLQNRTDLLNVEEKPFYFLNPFYLFKGDIGNSERKLRHYVDYLYYHRRNKQWLVPVTGSPLHSPEFLHNVPPFQSFYSLPLAPWEYKYRFEPDLEDVAYNILYCSTGEICLFLYAWRLILRGLQFLEGNDTIDIVKERIGDGNLESSNLIWDVEFWPKDLPEHYWSKAIKVKEYKDLFDSDISNSIEYHINLSQKLALERPGEGDFSFLKEEWDLLGLNNPVWGRKVVSEFLLFVVDILQAFPLQRNTPRVSYLEDCEDLELMRYSSKLQKLHTNFQSNPSESTQRLIHEMLVELIFYLFSTDKKKRSFSKSDLMELLRNLHLSSRFPILPYYYQTFLSDHGLVREHLIFPVGANSEISQSILLPIESEDGLEIQSNYHTFALFSINPVFSLYEGFWQRGEDLKIRMAREAGLKTSIVNREKGQYLISEKFRDQISTIVMVSKALASDIIDQGFYKETFIQEILKRRESASAHEVKKLISLISKDSPKWILDELRSFFLSELVATGENKSEDKLYKSLFDVKKEDLNFSVLEVVKRNLRKAIIINIISNTSLRSEIPKSEPEEFQLEKLEKMILTALNEIEISLENHVIIEKKSVIYFELALICAFRNSMEHSPTNSKILVKMAQDSSALHIINMIQDYSDGYKRDKAKLGSTENTLRYYFKIYYPEAADKLSIETSSEAQTVTTIVPIKIVMP